MDKIKEELVTVLLTRHDYRLLNQSNKPEYTQYDGQKVTRDKWDEIMKYLQKLNDKYWKKHNRYPLYAETDLVGQEGLLN